MPKFVLDLQTPEATREFSSLDEFTRGYIEAAFFTECETGTLQKPGRGDHMRKWNPETDSGLPGDVGFANLSEKTLARMVADCREFQKKAGGILESAYIASHNNSKLYPNCNDAYAGHDFWLTRNGHGAGFWDGDWPKPYGTQLTKAAKAFGSVSLYLGDNGKIYAM